MRKIFFIGQTKYVFMTTNGPQMSILLVVVQLLTNEYGHLWGGHH